MTNVCAETINCNNLITINNSSYNANRVIVKSAKVTFENVNNTNASAFLRHAGFFQVNWPANHLLNTINVIITNSDIVMENTDDTHICVADGTNAITGTSTNIVMNQSYGSTVDGSSLLSGDNSGRKRTFIHSDITGPNLNDPVQNFFSTEDRTMTGVIFHDADGVTDGNGDGATHVSGLDTVVIYVEFIGLNLNLNKNDL